MLLFPGRVPTSSSTQTFGYQNSFIINSIPDGETNLQHWGECIEEPPMTIYFLLVLFLHAEYYLCRHNTFVRVFELNVGIQGERGCIFKQMCGNFLAVDHVLHVVSRLVHA